MIINEQLLKLGSGCTDLKILFLACCKITEYMRYGDGPKIRTKEAYKLALKFPDLWNYISDKMNGVL